MKTSCLSALALPALLLLAGCQVTTFERVPLAAEACDQALAGTWLSTDEDPEDVGEMTLKLGADCQLEVIERTAEGQRTGEATRVQLGRRGDHRYAWVDGRWLMRRFDEDHDMPEGDQHLVRFSVEGDLLTLWSSNDKAIAHAIIEDDLNGEVIARDRRLFNRLTGEQDPAVLEGKDFFDAEPLQFKRAGAPGQ